MNFRTLLGQTVLYFIILGCIACGNNTSSNETADIPILEREELSDAYEIGADLDKELQLAQEKIDNQSASHIEYHKIALILEEKEQFEKALEFYTTAIEKAPEKFQADIYDDRAMLHSNMGDTTLAFSDYRKAIELKPQRSDFHYYYYVYKGAVLQDSALALKLFNQAFEAYPNDPYWFNTRAELYAQMNLLDSALNDYKRAIELKDDDPLFYNERGNIYRAKNQTTQALVNYQKALEFDPENPWYLYNRALVLLDLQDLEGALKDLNKASESDVDILPIILGTQGDILFQMDQTEAACNAWEESASFGDQASITNLERHCNQAKD